MRVLSVILVLAGLGPGAAGAEEPLTDAQLERYAASVVEARDLLAHYRSQGEWDYDPRSLRPEAGKPYRPMSGPLEVLKTRPFYPEWLEIIRRHGFQTAEQWGRVGDRVARALGHLYSEPDMPELEAARDAEIRRLRESEGLNAAQKEAMIAIVEQSWADFLSMQATTPEDLEVVRRNLAVLKEAQPD